MFHGSYCPDEVSFLLKRLDLQPMTDVVEKERLIQSGARHYSEIIGVERPPSAEYLHLFDEAVQANADRTARDVFRLARRLRRARPGEVTLVSLARAGTPVGVLLRHVLRDYFDCDAPHYCISIIRDRGLDRNALNFILRERPAESIAFVDGWTGKGTIANELVRSLASFNAERAAPVPGGLFVLCDLSGHAQACGSNEDYLIPSAILNATVSGLVSRSILNDRIGPDDFHGCLHFPELATSDRSRWFVERIRAAVAQQADALARESLAETPAAQNRVEPLIARLMQRYAVTDRNYLKPGIGEATRSLLRRVPRLLILRDARLPELRHLVLLARERQVPVEVVPSLPLKAVALIRKLSDA
ncbi:MAG: cysteine protease StiP family protein [Panacagrimonas sp.]